MAHTPSIFQQDIYDVIPNGTTNVVVSAVAGSGKTTTIAHAVTLTPKESDKIFLAFNNTIVDELKERIVYPNCQVTTMHSFCWRAILKSTNYKAKLDNSKSFKIIKKLLVKFEVPKKSIGYYTFVIIKLVDLARHHLLTDFEEVEWIADRHDLEVQEEMIDIALETLVLMNEDYKTYDFTDMIYRACIDKVRMPKFDFIFVDESQDLSSAQQHIITQIKKREGRMIAVGDPSQAIYGFAGADANSYGNLKTMFPNTIELPLSVNYRCGKRIVKEAQKINNQILPYGGNDDGEVRNGFCKEITTDDWVLCRNLKPLIILNLYLLGQGVRSYIRGVDIGKNLEKYVTSFGVKTTKQLWIAIDNDIQNEIQKLRNKGVRKPLNTSKIDRLIQQRDILKVISHNKTIIKSVVDKIQAIFKEQKNSAVLSTIHKSKGLENDRIFFLCPELIPSKYATQPWQLKQESNLQYVAITRAKKSLIYVDDFIEIEEEIFKKIENEK